MLLAQYFLDEIGRAESVEKRFTERALGQLQGYAWPGNIRELRNVVHSAFILAGASIDAEHLPLEVQAGVQPPVREANLANRDAVRELVGRPLAEIERRLITATLAACEGNKGKAAGLLGISLKTLYNRLHAYQGDAPAEPASALAGPPPRGEA